ncbi:hypothetical protein A2982_01105 [candidate division WWE3 bacterium RIFCSPLOWO2_01_FULL_39_13]|uniref:Uncharacterized protein n=1 Tax=candidate division WWE3 bacterium RIFCSPLOWO2_01_FULL_39_13 TaxID=1802624 RepID=A0A1F4V3I4_UNCKA|nr:MAG: hypothetical protein A2982_01105 [candidate division WWE3 bacterium RIFCSPLOWO2_01_FULL_39_13]
MNLIDLIGSAWKLINIFHNTRVSILSESWARMVQRLANDFTVLEHDIKTNKKYGGSKDVQEVATRLGDMNRETHTLWLEMKNNLGIKEDK